MNRGDRVRRRDDGKIGCVICTYRDGPIVHGELEYEIRTPWTGLGAQYVYFEEDGEVELHVDEELTTLVLS